MIRIIKNCRFFDLLTPDEDHFEIWKSKLFLMFNQINFHKRFKNIKMIGKGTYARVYLEENKKNKNRFAVKAFNKEVLLNMKNGKKSLKNEISLLRKLKHKNIMQLIEVQES